MKFKLLCTVGGNVFKMVQPLVENRMADPQEIKNRIITWSSNSASGDIPKRMESRSPRDNFHVHKNT